MKRFVAVAIVACCAASIAAFAAEAAGPVGTWKTVDDNTGKAKAHVEIREKGGVLYGKITKLISPEVPNPLCDKCSDHQKDKPVLGMQILWGLKKSGNAEWSDGYILDPENGKVYRCKITLSGGGATLEVRGYLGFSLLGRTQKWSRIR